MDINCAEFKTTELEKVEIKSNETYQDIKTNITDNQQDIKHNNKRKYYYPNHVEQVNIQICHKKSK